MTARWEACAAAPVPGAEDLMKNQKRPALSGQAVEPINIGLDDRKRAHFSEALSAILDDTYSLLIHTHIYHWNVRGPLFEPIHKLLEQQYEALFAATDKIAERVRQLGHRVPEGLKHFPRGFDMPAEMPNEHEMIVDLVAKHEEVIRKLRKTSTEADDEHDYVTQDLVNEILAFHENAAWMLRSIVTRWPTAVPHAQAAE
jgi:starvation-inducible DNA-binding protein